MAQAIPPSSVPRPPGSVGSQPPRPAPQPPRVNLFQVDGFILDNLNRR
jgi:hypothetical protein